MKKKQNKQIFLKFTGFLVILIFSIEAASFGQTRNVTIDECVTKAQNNYPLIKSADLISQSESFSIHNIKTAFLPSVSLNGQYTYQSDVTNLPIELPSIDIPELDKEQYKVYAEINQLIYDGGANRTRQEAARAQTQIELKRLETELYEVKERVTELYFGILLTELQIEQTKILQNDIQAGIAKMQTAFKEGTVLQSNVDVLSAEALKTDQRMIDLVTSRKSLITMLSAFIGEPLSKDSRFETPQIIDLNDTLGYRPEMNLFNAQLKAIDTQTSLINSKNRPRISGFIQSGYGSPALNMLSPDADTYYLAGLRLTWPLSGFYTINREKAINQLAKNNIEIQKEVFLFNTNQRLIKENSEIERIEQLIETDKDIVKLRERVKQASLVQLENGIITSTEYLRDVMAADQAGVTMQLHKIQLLSAKYKHQLITGNRY